ncbi:hypothetical protein CS022_03200 [Veronia nyctiphanis]|uniref:DUF3833 domain-containing protein n=1 Tax=Veronia nyctiphanis TaxID=1278244 RepID=A0A4Q0YZE3_9GAMM|nr:DUF3833 domain-containing protein [Veronia nyctiphanis]RXJ74589.1 hypothetical protein CS022_03200 [Veronia nyctiphanis]
MKLLFTLSAALLFLTSCSAKIDDYAQNTPEFALFDYFDGQVTAWGMVQDYSGKQTRRFSVNIDGTVEGNQLTLDETFFFDDGEEQKRIWKIQRNADGTYEGTAGDVVGNAVGRSVGNAFHWVYQLEVVVDDTTYVLTMDDWLYRHDEKHLFNRTSMKKFGVEVGEVTLFFTKS